MGNRNLYPDGEMYIDGAIFAEYDDDFTFRTYGELPVGGENLSANRPALFNPVIVVLITTTIAIIVINNKTRKTPNKVDA